jgi:hypothetical protein
MNRRCVVPDGANTGQQVARYNFVGPQEIEKKLGKSFLQQAGLVAPPASALDSDGSSRCAEAPYHGLAQLQASLRPCGHHALPASWIPLDSTCNTPRIRRSDCNVSQKRVRAA